MIIFGIEQQKKIHVLTTQLMPTPLSLFSELSVSNLLMMKITQVSEHTSISYCWVCA